MSAGTSVWLWGRRRVHVVPRASLPHVQLCGVWRAAVHDSTELHRVGHHEWTQKYVSQTHKWAFTLVFQTLALGQNILKIMGFVFTFETYLEWIMLIIAVRILCTDHAFLAQNIFELISLTSIFASILKAISIWHRFTASSITMLPLSPGINMAYIWTVSRPWLITFTRERALNFSFPNSTALILLFHQQYSSYWTFVCWLDPDIKVYLQLYNFCICTFCCKCVYMCLW